MLKRIPWSLFYTGVLILLVLLACYFLKWIEIIFLINYLLYLFAFLSFALTWSLVLKLMMPFKLISLTLSISGACLWILALRNYIDFEAYWNIAFSLMMTGLLIALFGKTTRNASANVKLYTAITLINLLCCFYLTGMAFFESSIYLIISLAAHTVTTLWGQFKKIVVA